MLQVLFYSKIASKTAQVRTWGRQTCFLPRAPSNLVTPWVGACFGPISGLHTEVFRNDGTLLSPVTVEAVEFILSSIKNAYFSFLVMTNY